jgi:hypothetical protein
VFHFLSFGKKRERITYGSPWWRWFKPQGLVVGGLDVLKMVGVIVGVVPIFLDHLLEKADGVPRRRNNCNSTKTRHFRHFAMSYNRLATDPKPMNITDN